MAEKGEERKRRLVFGEDAERYDRARPSYPAALVDDLVDWVGPTGRAVDVGCGTGRAAMLLAARGLAGVGVEAHPEMATVARRNLAPYPAWRVDVSDFEAWQPSPGSDDVPADLVTSAQAWHWVDPAVGWDRAAAILRPGGWLALWWNWPASEPEDLGAALDAVYARHGTELDFRNIRPDTEVLDAPPPGPPFAPPVDRRYPWTQTYTTAELVDLLGTHSATRVVGADRLDALLADVAAALDAHGGRFEQHYVCQLRATQRL
jgi:SAM-dependent methyltransferase